MLVLSRRVGQKFYIGDDIVVTVIGVRGEDIRLGIEAPKHVKINRAELLDAVVRANQAASDTQADEQRALAALEDAARVVAGRLAG